MEWKYEEGRIFSIDDKGNSISEITYNYKRAGVVNINHVYVRPDSRKSGIAGESMEVLMNYLRKKNLKVTATCSYANSWLRKNSDKYSDVIAEELINESIACSIKSKH